MAVKQNRQLKSYKLNAHKGICKQGVGKVMHVEHFKSMSFFHLTHQSLESR